MKHLQNQGKNSLYIGVGGMVNKSRLQGLVYPGKYSVDIGVGRMVEKPHLQGLIYQGKSSVSIQWLRCHA